MLLCKYKNALGQPGKGIHSHRLGGLAVADVIGTIVIGWALALLMRWNRAWTILGFWCLGILLHWLFCVDTSIHKLLF